MINILKKQFIIAMDQMPMVCVHEGVPRSSTRSPSKL
jgi:hypothetical protein